MESTAQTPIPTVVDSGTPSASLRGKTATIAQRVKAAVRR